MFGRNFFRACIAVIALLVADDFVRHHNDEASTFFIRGLLLGLAVASIILWPERPPYEGEIIE